MSGCLRKRHRVGIKLVLRGRQWVVAKFLEVEGFKNVNYAWKKRRTTPQEGMKAVRDPVRG